MQVLAYTGAEQVNTPFVSDAAIKMIIDAGLAMALIAFMALGLWVVLRPIIIRLVNRDDGKDKQTEAWIKQAADTHEDNRKLIKVIEDGREDDRKQTEAIQALTSAIQQQTATTAKLIDVAMGQIQTAQQEAQKLPALLQAQRDTSVEQVWQAMTQAFELRDEKFERILKRLDELDHKFDANEAVTEEMKALLNEVLTLLKTAQPVEHKDTGPLPSISITNNAAPPPLSQTGPLPPLPDAPPDARKEAPAPTGTPHSSIDKPEEG